MIENNKKKKVKKEEEPTDSQEAPSEKPRQHYEDIDLNTAIEKINATTEGPEIYSLLVNNSIATTLNNAEQFLTTLRWGKQKKLIQQVGNKIKMNEQLI